MKMLKREVSRCASAEVVHLGHHLQMCYVAGGLPPLPHTPSPWEPHIIKELRALRSCVSEGGQAGQGKNLVTSSADLRVHIHQHLASRLQALPAHFMGIVWRVPP